MRCYQNGKTGWGSLSFMLTHCFTITQSGRVDPTIQALFQDVGMTYSRETVEERLLILLWSPLPRTPLMTMTYHQSQV